MNDSERRQRMISSTPRLTPDEVAARTFPTSFRGVSETDVRAFLKRVSEELGASRAREQELMGTIDELEARLRTPRPLDEQELLDALGEETTRLLRSAREAAADIRAKAEERASKLVHDAHEESQRLRQEAEDVLGVRTQEADSVGQGLLQEAEQRASDLMRVADERAAEVRTAAEHHAEELRARVERDSTIEIENAREGGRSLLEEATNLRQRVIDDLSRRRELLTGQLEELRSGRDELLDAYRVVKRTFLEATEALAQVEARATAGRATAASDATDLAGALEAEGEAARNAGLESSAVDAPSAVDEPAGAEASEPTAPDTSAPEPTAAPAEEAEPAAVPNLAAVDDLFARLRAGAQAEAEAEVDLTVEAAAEDAKPADAPAAGEQTGAAPASALPTPDIADIGDDDEAPAWLAHRDEVLAPLRVTLVRQMKLAIGNEQNEVLDKVRRQKGKPAAASALPEVDAQTETWAAVVAGATAQAYRLGRAGVNGGDDPNGQDAPADLASTLARAMVEPLRDRLVATIDGAHEPGETTSQVVERIGARYREWKNRAAESSAQDALVAAYARGHYDRAGDGAVLTWRVPPGGCCVDCADNALEPTRKGDDFPTGQAYPPAHPGCRCGLTSEVSAAASGGVGAESTRTT